jgi:putative heme-binding domain-containing protein
MRPEFSRKRSIIAAFLAFLLTACLAGAGVLAQGQGQAHPGEYSQADVAAGAEVYRANCTGCHAPTGDGVGTVDLRRGRFRNASSDEDVMRVISNGIPGTAMQSFKLSQNELTAIVAFIRAGFDVNARAIKVGDPTRGRALFEGKGGCGKCHRVNGRGPRSAPDLSDVGSARLAASIQGSIIDPTTYMMPINRPVRVVTKGGQVVTGRRLNEDTFTVQLIDDKERLISLNKSDLREYEILKTSPMPSFRDKLNVDEIADVVAYLLSLKG